jgi:hypothetical protein
MIDETDPEPNVRRKRRVLVCAGVNGGADHTRLFYRIEGVEVDGRSTSRVRWIDGPAGTEPGVSGDDAPGDARDETDSEDAGDGVEAVWPVRQAEIWLRGRLARAEPTPSTIVIADAEAASFGERTVRRAARNIGVVVTKTDGAAKPDLWSLPVSDSVTV